MRPYSMDLRERVLADCATGLRARAVAEKYRVSESWVRRLCQRQRQTGETAPRRAARCGPAPTLGGDYDRLRALVRASPGLTAGQYRDRLGVTVSVVTVWRALRRLGLLTPGRRARPVRPRPTTPT